MNELEFYHFKDIMHKQQPYNSNWCWAASLSSMIDGLKANSEIGKTQCNLASYYKEYIKSKNVIIQEYDGCCVNLHNTSSDCNQGIKDGHVIDIFEASGFEATKVQDKRMLRYYDWVEQTLRKNQSPLLIKYRLNGQAHASLITGFGKINDTCEYLLISDPVNKYADEYKHISKVNDLNIEKIWETEKINQNKLIVDQEIIDRHNRILEFLEEADFNNDELMTDALNYLGHKYPAEIISMIDEFNFFKSINRLRMENLKSDFGNQKISGQCQQYIVKNADEQGNIVGIKFEDLDNPTESTLEVLNNPKIDCRSYVDGYAIELRVILRNDNDRFNQIISNTQHQIGSDTTVNHHIHFNHFEDNYNELRILVLPINFPMDYNITPSFQSLTDFKEELENLPKASFFSLEEPRTLNA